MGSVTGLIGEFRGGDPLAFADLCGRFLPKLAAYANRRLGNARAGVDDGEDVALAAFLAFWEVVTDGRPFLGQLSDRESLWRILTTLANQKVRRSRRDSTRLKRDYRKTLREADHSCTDNAGTCHPLASQQEEPEAALLLAEAISQWLEPLTQGQRLIVNLKRIGATNLEIADHLGVSLRAVERELSEIRSVWRERFRDVTGLPPSA
ncbi:MAG TPA: ECF-type sigma factor [Gemmataceae bacterium]|nr:ECF-type sigma factor [Gemmataceae bacterium]